LLIWASVHILAISSVRTVVDMCLVTSRMWARTQRRLTKSEYIEQVLGKLLHQMERSWDAGLP
jgi:hypothetical protein